MNSNELPSRNETPLETAIRKHGREGDDFECMVRVLTENPPPKTPQSIPQKIKNATGHIFKALFTNQSMSPPPKTLNRTLRAGDNFDEIRNMIKQTLRLNTHCKVDLFHKRTPDTPAQTAQKFMDRLVHEFMHTPPNGNDIYVRTDLTPEFIQELELGLHHITGDIQQRLISQLGLDPNSIDEDITLDQFPSSADAKEKEKRRSQIEIPFEYKQKYLKTLRREEITGASLPLSEPEKF